MKPLSLRVRLTLGFALVMAVLLTGAGLFIYGRVGSDLDAGIDRALRARAADLTALVSQSDTGLKEAASGGLVETGTDFAQVLNARAKVVDSTPGLSSKPVLNPQTLHAALLHPVTVKRTSIPGGGVPFSLYAAPVRAQGGQLVIVAGASLEDRDQALARLRSVMLVGGPALLLLASLAGYGLAALALRPVERMRGRAQSISANRLRTRLPTTGSGDEIDRLATTLNETLDRVEDGIKHEQAFVADASHELRTPLTVLRTQLELIGDEHAATEQAQRDIGSAIEEVDRLAKLAEDLLLVARSDRGELAIEAEPIDAGRLLERVGERMRIRQPDGVEIAPPKEQLWLRGDEGRLEQALLNLAENAVRHGGGRAQLEARRMNGQIELHVLDDGPGFPEGFAPKAFERFSQAEPGRSGDGAGLGLAIVLAIAEAHGGAAGVANRPSGGADAWLSAPALDVGSPQAPRNVSAQSSDGR